MSDMTPFQTHIIDQCFVSNDVIITPTIRADIAFVMTTFGPLWDVADIEGEDGDPAVAWTYEQFAGLILPFQSAIYLFRPLITGTALNTVSVERVAYDIIDDMCTTGEGFAEALQGQSPFHDLGPLAAAAGVTEEHLDRYETLIEHFTAVPDPLMIDDVRRRLAAGDPCTDAVAVVDARYALYSREL